MEEWVTRVKRPGQDWFACKDSLLDCLSVIKMPLSLNHRHLALGFRAETVKMKVLADPGCGPIFRFVD